MGNITAILEALEGAYALVKKLTALAKQAGATDEQLDAMDTRLTAAHERRQADQAGQ